MAQRPAQQPAADQLGCDHPDWDLVNHIFQGRRWQRPRPANLLLGIAGAAAGGLLWCSYFISIKLASASVWVANFPLAVGMLTGSLVLALLTRQPLRPARRSDLCAPTRPACC